MAPVAVAPHHSRGRAKMVGMVPLLIVDDKFFTYILN
jgi:hypothetical protein